MPQVEDFEASVSGGDNKVACETGLDDAGAPTKPQPPPYRLLPEDDPYFPPDAIVVPLDGMIDLADLDVNIVYDREDSTKGSTNPKSSNANIKSRTNSDHFPSANIAAKPPIIGLPSKVQTAGFTFGRSGRRPPQVPIFPKKDAVARGDGSGGRKSAVPEVEPGSPTVSCFGKVLSNRERQRLRQTSQTREPARKGTTGCWAIFRCGTPAAVDENDEGSGAPGVFHSTQARRAKRDSAAERRTEMQEAAAAPGLGGVKRFSSGRRAASWGSEAEEGGAERHMSSS